jgi:hypothetical protein
MDPIRREEPRPERRRSDRRVVDAPGTIHLENGRQRDCRVVNLSETGAKLAVVAGLMLPERFSLALGIRRPRPVRVAWRKGPELGVAFES